MVFQISASSTPNYYAIPLAPGPIRVQSCVWCLFWTNRNCMSVSSIFLSISSSRFKSPLYQINWLQHSALFFLLILAKNIFLNLSNNKNNLNKILNIECLEGQKGFRLTSVSFGQTDIRYSYIHISFKQILGTYIFTNPLNRY